MYNIQVITESLRGLIGFRQHDDDILPEITDELTGSRSGLFLDNAHSLITAPVLAGAALLRVPSDTDDALSEYITRTLDDSLADVLIALRTRKLLRMEGKSLMAKTQLYDGEGSISDLIQPAGRFVGLQLVPSEPKIALKIQAIGLQFTGPVSNLQIVAYGDPTKDPIVTTTVSTSYQGRMQWAQLATPMYLSGFDSYVVGYNEADLPNGISAIRRNKSIGYVSCAACSPVNAQLSKVWSPYLSVNAVRIDNPGGPVDQISESNFGMNLAISVGCDITNLIISQQMQLAEAIRQQAVVKMLSDLAYSTVVSTVEQQTRQNAMFALKNGEEAKLEKLLNALDIDLSGLSTRCLPEVNTPAMPVRRTVFR